MARVILIVIALVGALSAPMHQTAGSDQGQLQDQTSQRAVTPQERAIQVSIATVGSFFGPPTDRFKVGDQILITITMTNTSAAQVDACLSANLYQNLPKLTKDGMVVPYMQWESYERVNAQRNRTCEEENLPEKVSLKPNVASLADWFVLVDSGIATGAEAWYDSLPPGKYELSIQRRLGCCDGPMVQSNKISFEVVP